MARRKFDVFSLSFLDCICCGFGAVILLFVIVNAKAAVVRNEQVKDLSGEVEKWEKLVLEGKKNLVVARNAVEEVVDELAKTEGLSREVIKTIEEKKVELAQAEGDTTATKEHANQLKSDIKALEEGIKRLEGGSESVEDGGSKVREFAGDGDRQYLTGLKVGGRRILVLIDGSASMLGDTIVDIVRRRAGTDEQKRASPKWQRMVRTVDWISTQLPPTSEFQMITFNETAAPLVPGSEGAWHNAGDPKLLNDNIKALKQFVPENGTSLHQAFASVWKMNPRPDNIFLLIDSLPSVGEKRGFGKKVSAKKRLSIYNDAIKELPARTPVNIILFPMEGDPLAASSYWTLAIRSSGSFFCPAEDWP